MRGRLFIGGVSACMHMRVHTRMHWCPHLCALERLEAGGGVGVVALGR